MFRQTIRSLGALSLTDNSLPSGQLSRSFSSHPKPTDGNAEEDEISTAQKWLADLSKTIPVNIASFTLSKSSGPGGQHVNKCVEPEHRTIHDNWF